MLDFANSSFDPKSIVVLRGAADRAWRALSHKRQTVQNNNPIADTVVQSAAQREDNLVRCPISR